jgi:hypothetical protein
MKFGFKSTEVDYVVIVVVFHVHKLILKKTVAHGNVNMSEGNNELSKDICFMGLL